MSTTEYHMGQLVFVESRQWAGINRPGGVGRIVRIDRCQYGYVETVDVKYVVGTGRDTKIDLDFVRPNEELERTSRSRRGRDFYQGSPAKANPTSQLLESSHKTKIKKRRKVSPSPGRCVPKTAADDLPTITKASTARFTMATEQVTTSKLSSSKPPVQYVVIPPNPPDISPLPCHNSAAAFALKKRDGKEKVQETKERKASSGSHVLFPCTQPRATEASSGEKNRKESYDFVQHGTRCNPLHGAGKPDNQSKQLLERKLTATEEMKKKLAHPKLPLAASRRVPLRQVFDHDMNVRQNFVNDVVGATTKQSDPAMTIDVFVDECRQKSFNERLTQLFREYGDSVAKMELITKLSDFTSMELDTCLDLLARQNLVMVSNGEIYKI